jgi:hypothetical protein
MQKRCHVLLVSLAVSRCLMAEPPAAAVAAFQSYTRAVESRLAEQHRSPNGFLAAEMPLGRGDVHIDRLAPRPHRELSDALLHHWRGTTFSPGARALDFEQLLRNINSYPQHFAPQVLQARVLEERDGRTEATLRVRQKHVITVVMDSDYDVTFGRLDAQHGFSISRSTRISEIDSPGTRQEHPLGAGEEHGFLWRLNTYWSYEERNGGLYLQLETVSLTRSIPLGLGWAIRPYVVSIPRESLEFTLRAASAALQKQSESRLQAPKEKLHP